MDPVRFGKNLLMALVLLGVIAVLHAGDLPATRRLEEYIAYVLTTDLEYRPLVELSRSLGLWGEEGGLFGWWGRWREEPPAAPATAGSTASGAGTDLTAPSGTPEPSFLLAPQAGAW